jgi:hypothetical protein
MARHKRLRPPESPPDCLSGFPTTRRSALLAAQSPDAEERRRGYGAIVAVYWKPAYAYVRLHWKEPPEDARDLVQGFFAHAYQQGFFERARRVNSLTWGVVFGLAVGLVLAYLAAAMPDPSVKHYDLEIMLPGALVGLIVGYATQRYGRPATTAKA